MAHIENPYGLDVEDDDALFAGALSNGLIWIEDDEDDEDADDVLETAADFIRASGEEWVNFSRLGQHLNKTFQQIDLRRLARNGERYKGLSQFFADHSNLFEMRQDDTRQGLYWIRLKSER